MKQLLAVIILCFTVISSSYGQSTDTTKSVIIKIDCSPKVLDPDRQPLYVVTYGQEKVLVHKEMKSAFERIGPEKISSLDMMKPEEARVVYGEAASNGVILISLDESLVKRREWDRLKKAQLN